MRHRSPTAGATAAALAILAVLATAASPATAELLANDAWLDGQAVNFQGGFVSDETAAVRLVPSGPCPCQVDEVRFLFGGAGTTETVTLLIWEDAGAFAPGALVYSQTMQLTGTSEFMQSVDLRAYGVFVGGPFRVGLRFTHTGFPSVAADIGDIDTAGNFIDEATLGWLPSYLLGVAGDWVIRALVDSGTPGGGTLLANDGWVDGQTVAFHGGFVAGETAAVRLAPLGPCPCRLDRIQFLFGGAAGTHDVTFHVWDDSALTDAPGAELYATTLSITGSDEFMQEVDIGAVGVMVDGPFRVGLEFTHTGPPSVATDVDGIQPASNFIDEISLGWQEASTLLVNGDFVVRAVLDASTATGGGTLVNNDTWLPGQTVAFQGGFVAGETAAARLVPAGPCPCPVERVQFLFGGAPGTHDVTLRIWDDGALTDAPGTELYATTLALAGSDEFLQEVDLSVSDVVVAGPFRVGLEFTHTGLPSVATDVDGIVPDANWIDKQTLGWREGSTLGLTGDFVIRAVLPGPSAGELVHNDTWIPGQAVSFQAGFVAGETAAARFVPAGPCPCDLDRIQLLFGGDPSTENVVLRVWDDAAMTLAPGPELFSAALQLTGSDLFLQELDLTVAGITVNGPFRVGIEVAHDGPPAVAADTDGITPLRNFIDAQGGGWTEASTLGVSGDWVLRAVLDSVPGSLLAVDSFAAAASTGTASALGAGDTAAVRLIPTGDCPCPLEDVRVLFGGGGGDTVVTLHVWDDGAMATAPGAALYTRDVSLSPDDQALQVIDLAGEGVVVDGPFRVGIELHGNGPPAVRVDGDGVTPGRSFVETGAGWTDAASAGVGGDFVLRATIAAPAATSVPALSAWGVAALAASIVAGSAARRRTAR